MIRLLIALCALSAAWGQPTACIDDSQCTSGYYCLAEYCRKCLQCEDLRRQPPTGHVACVRSVSECGPCLKGYVDDRLGMGASCAEPESAQAAPWYVWLLGVLLIAALLACAVGVVIYALRNTDSFRVLALTRTSVETPGVGKAVAVAPTAPQPPPYNYGAPYEPVRPASPGAAPAPAPAPRLGNGDYAYRPDTDSNTDVLQPLVKRVPGGAGDAAREAAGSQSARVYTNPAYVRNVPPPSYDSAVSDHEAEVEGPYVHDEDTMPSIWTPSTDNNANGNEHTGETDEGGATGGAGALEVVGATGATGATSATGAAGALRRAARGGGSETPPNKVMRTEDSNNNRNRSGEAGGSGLTPPAPAPPSVVINVLNVNALHQRNELSL